MSFLQKKLSFPQFFTIFHTSCRNLVLIGAKMRNLWNLFVNLNTRVWSALTLTLATLTLAYFKAMWKVNYNSDLCKVTGKIKKYQIFQKTWVVSNSLSTIFISENSTIIDAKLGEMFSELIFAYLNACNTCVRQTLKQQ